MSIFQAFFQKISVVITSIVLVVTGIFTGPKLESTPSPTPVVEQQAEPSPVLSEKDEQEKEQVRPVKPRATLKPSPNFSPVATVSISTTPTPTTASYYSDKYATVVKFTDSKGNINPQSEYNKSNPTWFQPWPELKVGETVTFSVEVKNPVADPVLYQFVGTGFPGIWQTDNKVTVTINSQIFNVETIHLRVFVKNSDDQFRAPYFDDMIQVFYTKVD